MKRAVTSGGSRPAPVREIVVGLAVFALYSLVNALDWSGRTSAAESHAHSILRLEQRLHLDPERALNDWLAPHHTLRVMANYEYAITYVISAFALLLWLWIKRPDLYRSARNSFVVLNLLGITGFLVYPLMPPRLLPEAGFTDTVLLGKTWGSWGSPLVGHANQLAAMPSLHFAWALWVSVVLATISGGWKTQAVSAVHVLITLWVILATGNHFLLDALVATALVWISVRLAGTGNRVPSADAFFLHVESDLAPQHVGGVVLLNTGGGPPPTREAVEDLMRRQLGDVDRFRQRLIPGTRLRRPRWSPPGEIDWTAHVPLVDVTRADGSFGGLTGFHEAVARIQEIPLPRDRPLWKMVVVHGIAQDRAGVVFVVHHVVADGIGTVTQALRILEPQLPVVPFDQRPPGPLVKGAGTVVGIAQLATDGSPPSRLPSGGTYARQFGAVRLPLDAVRSLARRQGARVSDVLICVAVGGLRTAMLANGHEPPGRLRVSVPLMLRDPRETDVGNVTGAVMVDVPLGPMPETERLADIASRTARLRSPTRALAAGFVMQAAGTVLPPVLHGVFARHFYGPRTFAAIVSNMPGPDVQLSLAGARIDAAYPLLPLAPGSPVAIGSLGWNGELCLGISTDPALVADVHVLEAAITGTFRQLQVPVRSAAAAPGPPDAARAS